MKITFTIDADVSAEDIVTIMKEQARQEEERAERFNRNMPPPTIFGTPVDLTETVDDLIKKNKKDKPN